ncbi:MAG: hypothetical protein WCD70_11625, partial [Alphaproteobacteria bacterium]
MKNLPIVGKILTILGVFGVFVIAVAFYATSQITFINSEYTHLRNGQAQAVEDITAANSDANAIQASIEKLLIDYTAAATQADLANINLYKGEVANAMDQAAGDDLMDAKDIQALKAQILQVVDGDCAHTIQLGVEATTASQTVFLSDCEPKFPALALDMRALRTRIANGETTDAASLSSTAHNTITTTFVVIFAGLAVIMLGAFFAIRTWIVTPVRVLQGGMSRLSSGDLQASVAGAE